MKPSMLSNRKKDQINLLVIDRRIQHLKINDFSNLINEEDILVVNKSGTLPSIFKGIIKRNNRPIEIRLASFAGLNTKDLRIWNAFSFGSGEWYVPTEGRPLPPSLIEGDEIDFGTDLSATVVSEKLKRLVMLRFKSANLIPSLYKFGKPIQYSYLNNVLQVWDQQTLFSSIPISVEAPSASFPFSWELINKLKQKGVKIVPVLHGAGISSTGSVELDRLLPLEEYYEISNKASILINKAVKNKRQVVAVGTSALRAVESATINDQVTPGVNKTKLKIDSKYLFKTVTGLISGIHELGTSHRQLVSSFCNPELIDIGYREAQNRGYLGHEYGDITLLKCS